MKIPLAMTAMITFASFSIAQDESKSAAANNENEMKTKMQKFSIADDSLSFEAPATWKKVKPGIDFIHADFTIPGIDEDSRDGRITFSQVGGSVEANIERWIGQFQDIDPTDDEQVKQSEKTIDGKKVKLIVISGTFLDSAGGPFGPKTEREDYMLMGAAFSGDNKGNIFIKAYGPEKTMKSNRKAMETMLMGMKSID